MLAPEPARPGAQGADGERRRVVDEDGDLIQGLAGRRQPGELVVGQLALAHAVRRDVGLLGQDAAGQLLGRHLQGEEADHGAFRALGLMVGIGGVVRDVGGQRRLAHGGPSRDDDQVGGMQAAQDLVQIGEPGGHAGEPADAFVRRFGHVYGLENGVLEGLETAFVFAGGGQVVEALLGPLDLVDGGFVHLPGVGPVDQVLAQADQLPLQIEVVDDAAVLAGVDHGDGGIRQLGQVRRPADLGQGLVLLEVPLEGDGIGDLAPFDERRHRREDAAVVCQREVLWTQELRHPLVGAVIRQDGAEQRLFGLDVVGRRAQRRRRCGGAGQVLSRRGGQ